ncbi:MAG: RNA-binding protein [Thermoprotei archaeon]|nr:MAG: RNA-binding protein [Thermoprotei archaeon]RLE85412.1 MAG: RNA-binding protein [Thermoprotei archaeon]
MGTTLKLPICTSCGKPLAPYEPGVRFRCPNCGEITIWRCKLCRKQGNLYTCPNCGFIGP